MPTVPHHRIFLWIRKVCVSAIATVVIVHSASAQVTQAALDSLALPAGYDISVLTTVPGARSLSVAAPLDVVFIGTRGDTVFAAPLTCCNTVAAPVLTGLNGANGIVWRENYLYVAEQHRIVRYPADSLATLKRAQPEVLYDQLPDKSWHGWRVLAFGPDGMLYAALGSPCNICWPDGLEGSIIRLNPNTPSAPVVFASGIRNSVGLAFHPTSGALYFTDNGADEMGDDIPPDELNKATKAGQNFGFPYFGGGDSRTLRTRVFPLPDDLTPPIVKFQAHVAPLGLHFYQGSMLSRSKLGSLFVAQHGSWNRTDPVGYRLMRIGLDENGDAVSSTPFVSGWLQADGSAWGRPVDISELPDGSMIVSDDRADVVYRITYTTPDTAAKTRP